MKFTIENQININDSKMILLRLIFISCWKEKTYKNCIKNSDV